MGTALTVEWSIAQSTGEMAIPTDHHRIRLVVVYWYLDHVYEGTIVDAASFFSSGFAENLGSTTKKTLTRAWPRADKTIRLARSAIEVLRVARYVVAKAA